MLELLYALRLCVCELLSLFASICWFVVLCVVIVCWWFSAMVCLLGWLLVFVFCPFAGCFDLLGLVDWFVIVLIVVGIVNSVVFSFM